MRAGEGVGGGGGGGRGKETLLNLGVMFFIEEWTPFQKRLDLHESKQKKKNW